MKLSPDELEECYALLGSGVTMYGGEAMGPSVKRMAADCVIQAFEELVAEGGGIPTSKEVRGRAREIARRHATTDEQGREMVGSIILTAILMAFIGWVTRRILDFLVDRWT